MMTPVLFLLSFIIFSLLGEGRAFTITSSTKNLRHFRSSIRMFVDPLPVWRGVKRVMPPIVTGAYEAQTGEEYPGEALYNLVHLFSLCSFVNPLLNPILFSLLDSKIFVRTPTLVGGLLYFQRISEGKPEIVMDLGVGGPFELSPVIVCLVMWMILRPA